MTESASSSRKVLIITSSGGGGLLQAAYAKEQEIKSKFPDAIIVRRDVMKDWMWKGVGQWCVNRWNRAQIAGNVWVQEFFGVAAPAISIFFWPHIFFWTLFTLFKENIDQVIDTQVMGTSAIIKALRFFNRRRRKQIFLEKVLVDLPTKKATHFFHSIKALSKEDRKLFRLITIAPMLEKGETEAEFWKQNCNLTINELRYENYYVRQSFVKYRNLERKQEAFTIRLRFRNPEELELIQKSIHCGTAQVELLQQEIIFTIQPHVLVFTVLLGSQPAIEATLNYVKKFSELAKEKNRPAHLFVFCANHEPKEESLFQKVSQFVSESDGWPSCLTVIPMSFQSDETIAPLFFRSNATCTRSGGQTAMELMSVGKGEIWIHSEAKKQNGSTFLNQDLLKGIPCWESANAAYLQHVKNAKIVTTETFAPFARALMS